MAIHSGDLQKMSVFLQGPYKIPQYQRAYSWETDHIEDFWDDVLSTKESGADAIHFLGQIVVHEDENSGVKYIIDGQQRTITSMIFARSVQIICEKFFHGEEIQAEIKAAANSISNDITSQCLGKFNMLEKKPHLTLGEKEDDEYFQKYIVGSDIPEKKSKRASCERIRKALNFFSNHLESQLSEEADLAGKLKCLNAFFKTFTEQFKVMYVGATKLEEAFVIFETLNARGKALETADLLKNFIFSKSGKNLEKVQVAWNKMIESLYQSEPTKYIRYYWNSCHEYTQGKELYRTISKAVDNPRDSERLMEELKKYAPYYHDLAEPNECTEITDKTLIKSLLSLKTLKATSFYPILLAMYNGTNFTEGEICKVTETIETLFFRNLTICGKSTSKVERFLSSISLQIFNQELGTEESICDAIRAEMADDEEFQTSFEKWTGNNSNKEIVRYILRKINRHVDNTHEVSTNNEDVHLEHIMPQDCSKWDVDEETHTELLWRIGNLTLLSGPINRKLQNDPFNQKKQLYNNSKIDITKALCAHDVWDREAIENRQREFGQLAVDIWKK